MVIKYLQGLPIAILNDCLLPDRSALVLASSPGGGGNERSTGGGGTRRVLITLPVSVSLPLCPGPGDLREQSFDLCFWLLPDALLPVGKMHALLYIWLH